MIRSKRFYRIFLQCPMPTQNFVFKESIIFSGESSNFLQERSICLESTFGSRVNYFMSFSHQTIYRCFSSKTMRMVLEPKKINILQKEKPSVDSMVTDIVLLTWKTSNEEAAGSHIKNIASSTELQG